MAPIPVDRINRWTPLLVQSNDWACAEFSTTMLFGACGDPLSEARVDKLFGNRDTPHVGRHDAPRTDLAP